FASQIEVANGFEPLKIESRQFVEMLFPMCTMDFPFGQIDQSFEMPQVTLLQQGIQEHRAKRWRKRESQAYLHSILAPALQNLQQWNIRFSDGFEEPVLFEKSLVLRI